MGSGSRKSTGLTHVSCLNRVHTVTYFAGHGNRMVWEVWKAVQELTQVLIDLTTAPDQVDEFTMHIIKRFVILLYERTSTSTDVDKTHCMLFTRKNNVHRIPPTSAALKHNV